MGGGSAPQPYGDPVTNTATTQKYNLDAAAASQAASNVNQVTPFGSLSYTQSGTGPGGIPLYTSTSQLSPQMQAIVDALQGGITGQLGSANYGAGNAASTVGDATSGLTKWAMDKQVSYLDPFFTQQQEQLDNQLRNQGIFPGQPAYTQSMNNLSQSQNQSVTGFLAQIEPQMYQQATSQYMLPMGVSTGLYNMLNPNFFTQSLINPAQASVTPANFQSSVNAYQDAQQKAYEQQTKQNTALMSGLFGIPTAVLGGWAGSDAGGAALSGLFGSRTA